MEDIQTKEEFLEYLLQTREKRLNKVKEDTKELDVKILKATESDIWSEIENSPFTPKKVYEIYEKYFMSVFDNLLNSVDLDDFIKILEKKDDKCIKEKSLLRLPLKVQLLSEPIGRMLNNYPNISSIDLKSLEKSIVKNGPSFLNKEVPLYLKSWKDEDKELFFKELWKILKVINFTDEEIGFAWRAVILS